MRSYTHIAGAILFFMIFAFLFNINNILLGLFFACWMAVFPDILDRILNSHRGYGHTIFWIIPFLMIAYWNWTITAALIIGFFSHILLDTITTHGSPIFYPLWKTHFTCLNKKRRVKTGTNYDKAVFLFIILLLTPIIFFTVDTSTGGEILQDHNIMLTPNDNSHTINATGTVKITINLNFQLNNITNKNITINKINDSQTSVVIKDI